MYQSKIDHLVYAVPDLKKSIKDLSKLLGVEVIYGGEHKSEGTHNALVNLGNGCYLELLAIDKNNTNISKKRWMGMDLLTEPMLTRWAIKSDNLEEDAAILKAAHPQMGNIKTGSRKKTDGSTLSWALSMPLAAPLVEVLPFALDWKDSIHPTESLPDVCQLVELQATHPEPDTVLPTLEALGVTISLKKNTNASLTAVIQSPNGLVIL